ncbi:hypothetical protein TBR22_A14480 [Luteitalea sp. TBR-22]|uniref:L,D-transpeptidase family protein n=1 Tax=Luteitalea sp. TBR-22 TaxID=2802971 RepID=UPI001AF74054|nr:L,D-transpeptidase family protein [Luteitalea sp. TBR-22]BCS32238.1 hypothetical protein TBR22_A14480 [Luteitalea sp. TBR-22]
MLLRSLLALLSLAPLMAFQPATVAPDPDVAASVTRILGSARHPGLRWASIDDVSRDLWVVYEGEPDRLAWFDGGAPLPTTAAAVAAVADAARFGLDPEDYDATRLQAQWADLQGGPAAAATRAQFDVALSVAVARLARAVHVGRIEPELLGWKYAGAHQRHDGVAAVLNARTRGLAEVLRDLEPRADGYTQTRAALATYRALAALGEPVQVPPLPSTMPRLMAGATWAGVPALAARLVATGDLPSAPAMDRAPRYAGTLVDAVRRFQGRHGLEADGRVGAATLAALNVPLAERVRQIERSLERLRWLPDLADVPHILVNIASFRLRASDPRTPGPPLRMNVVVGGAADRQTPLFIEQLEYVEFRPFWNPPPSIVKDEILPKARADATFLARNAYEIVASRAASATAIEATPENLAKVEHGRLYIRQRPGPGNSLGLAKFVFPNDDAIYMHGTPTRHTFRKARRDASHGCIRVEHPEALAAWLLRGDAAWTARRIDAAMKAETTSRVMLDAPVPVILFYDTVQVSDTGDIAFLPDIYGHDRTLAAALARGYPYPAIPQAALPQAVGETSKR